MPNARWILHADMDAFYASVEQRDNPALRGKPVIVGGMSARGVVAAASYEARAYGVHSAMPGFRARTLCPNGIFVRPDMARYAAVSEQVHRVFGEFTPVIEPVALDEAFLDVSASVDLFGGPLELARRLKQRVREVTDLRISVGVAPNKLVAKIACTYGKPDGLIIVPSSAVRWFLNPLPVRRIWGVGPVLARALAALGIHTVAELAASDVQSLAVSIGERAWELVERARGNDSRAVESERAPKSYGEENTFEHDVLDRASVTAVLTAHAEAVARRLRHDGLRGRTITLKLKLAARSGLRFSRSTADAEEPIYPLLTRRKTLARATDDGALIRRVAVELWDAAALEQAIRLLGVSVSGLEPRESRQLELFPARTKADGLGRALDRITGRFGKSAIFRAIDTPAKASPTLRKKRGE